MGTHPIFESDFDCLTDVCFVLTKLKMRYVAAYLLAQLGGNDAPDAAAIKAILSSVGVDADKRNWAKSSPSSLAKTSTRSSPKVKKSSPPSHLVELPQLLVPPPVVPLRKHQRKRKRRRNPSLKMTT